MSQTINKILIANRGEIACRVMRTAKAMGINTVAIYSDADRNAPHVAQADEAVHIGPSPAAESYLVIDRVIGAAQSTGADAIHPGYGFLSENPDFVRACEKANIIFMGPKAESMEAMGLKDAAKRLMDEHQVPTTPGYLGDDQNPDTLLAAAREIGYPVLIKAVAGGGGKGMRKVDDDADFPAALSGCQREAQSSFADDRVLIEKYISSPRHIEVQIFGDQHGNVVHLFERDCSLQRRHQKVIEEAPAPGMTEAMRTAMTSAAINAAKAVDYVGAGTVEFIVDGSGDLDPDKFWFMEMNTRLQVEHPVSEMITGLDFVELQIRVARGEALPDQSTIELRGHAMEARLYAEDPAKGFLPSVGALDILDLPAQARVDTGVKAGGEVSMYYDPMIAKIACHAADRRQAAADLEVACRQTQVFPVKTNARFMARCLANAEFLDGQVSTHFIEKFNTELTQTVLEDDVNDLARALAPELGDSPFATTDGWRLNQPPRQTFTVRYQGEPLELDTLPRWTDTKVTRHEHASGTVVFVDGLAYLIERGAAGANQALGGNEINAPMPGKVIAIHVEAGSSVKKGQPLMVMEAMKMELTLDAPRDGVIAEVLADVDALVADGDVLLSLEEE